MANWSKLPLDLLEAITSYLPLSDINRFSAVCKSWRFIAKQRRYAPVAQLPWVVLTEDPKTGKRDFFNMSEKRHYYIDIPELHGGYCVGSSFGWLFIVNPKIEGYLVNPFTRAHYQFPPLPLFADELNLDHVVDGKITYEIDGIRETLKLTTLQKLNISKAVLSDDPNRCENFITMILVRGLGKMAFCKPKDNEWTVIHKGFKVNDVICYKGNFYAVGGGNVLLEVDLGPKPKMRMIKPWIRKYYRNNSRYLVDYFGEHLLLVYRNKVIDSDGVIDDSDGDSDYNSDSGSDIDIIQLMEEEEDAHSIALSDEEQDNDNDDGDRDTTAEHNDHGEEDAHSIVGSNENQGNDSDDDYSPYRFVTNYFVVFELDLEKKKWHRWGDLGGNALFVGTNRAIAVRASEFPECKADCIYFTSCSTDVGVSNDYGYDDHGVYNLIDRSTERFYEDHIPITSMPTWLVPNF